MREGISQQPKEGGALMGKDAVEDIRKKLIDGLKDALKQSRPDWDNRELCAEFIEDLENKRPLRIGGPFYADYFDNFLYDLGIRPRTDGKYEVIWEELKKGRI